MKQMELPFALSDEEFAKEIIRKKMEILGNTSCTIESLIKTIIKLRKRGRKIILRNDGFFHDIPFI